jgi:tetratricopeptide (TPR) repeat protein
MKSIYKIIAFSICIGLAGCEKFLEVETPPNFVSTESAYQQDNTASALVLSLYAKLASSGDGLLGTSVFTELSGDNLMMFNPQNAGTLLYKSFYQNELTARYTYGNVFWPSTYSLLYTINDAIAKLPEASNLTPALRTRLLGEVYFLRGFCYFYLINLYGDVPLILTTNPQINSSIARSSTNFVYSQILSDLKQAEGLLDNNYVSGDPTKFTTVERLRPNLAAVNAMLARVYLFQKRFAEAESSATKVINQNTIYGFSTLNNTFLKNSKETIWALQSVTGSFNTRSGAIYILPSSGFNSGNTPFYISTSLMNTFEAGDNRKNVWIQTANINNVSYPYTAKYRVPIVSNSINITEYDIVLRLAEQFLIRAEARNEQNNTVGAVEDINVLRARSRAIPTANVQNPLPPISTTKTQNELRLVISNERRVELFTEWGHRWFDLKRTGNIDAVMSIAAPNKGGTWANYKSLYPIPTSDILLNPALQQNPNYTN